MCRLYGMLANEPTKIDCGLVKKIKRSQDCGCHSDGWGVVCYDEEGRFRIPNVVKYRQTSHMKGVAPGSQLDTTYTKSVLAHVRSATVGGPAGLNAHPFTYDEWAFAHNGTIPAFQRIGPTLEEGIDAKFLNCRLGNTDSELFFLWLLYQLAAHGLDGINVSNQVEKARHVLSGAIAALAKDCATEAPDDTARLNFILTNGQLMFACCWNNPLYRIVRDGVYDCEECGVTHIRHQPSVDHRVVVVASKPLTNEHWLEIPNHSLLCVAANLTCSIDSITDLEAPLTA